MSGKGFFVCIEGLDKSGKTSQSHLLVDDLSRKGYGVIYTTEPSDGEIGRYIRSTVLIRQKRLSPRVEALLFASDRVDHTYRMIIPSLSEGKIVVCDRYTYSSLAYQGAAGVGIEWLKQINKSALKPNLAIYIDVPLKIVLQRYKHGKSVMEWPKIQKRVQKIYLQLVQKGDMISVNGDRPIEEVSTEISRLVLERINF